MRETTRIEDLAYCLMGLFGIHMPLLYGEGWRAFIRLQEEILKISDDYSLFAWVVSHPLLNIIQHASLPVTQHGLLAMSPALFKNSNNIVRIGREHKLFLSHGSLTTSNMGYHWTVPFVGPFIGDLAWVRGHKDEVLALLNCTESGPRETHTCYGIWLKDLSQTQSQLTLDRYQWSKLELIDLHDVTLPRHRVEDICVKRREPTVEFSHCIDADSEERIMNVLQRREIYW